jgi:hypothetical protein
MLSSTSSFERSLPDLPWMPIFGVALLGFFAFASFMEVRLAQLGYRPTVLDSKERWIEERSRVGKLGERALILVGASRIQLGIDLDTLRRETKLEPVQLAIDASSFVPTLKNLADDPTVRGTVLVDYYPGAVEGALSTGNNAAETLVNAYEKQRGNHVLFSLSYVEKFLSEILHENLRSFADGANPLTSLQWRIIPKQRASNYLITFPDRSRLADYRLVSMPKFYYWRVARNLGEEQSINIASANAEQVLRHKIELLQPHDNTAYIQGAKYLKQLVTKIESHGGKVFIITMPTSGMVREIDDKRYPRAKFWDLLKKETGISALNSADDPALQSFVCPDGSHLDFRDRTKFTEALVHALGITDQVKS